MLDELPNLLLLTHQKKCTVYKYIYCQNRRVKFLTFKLKNTWEYIGPFKMQGDAKKVFSTREATHCKVPDGLQTIQKLFLST